MAALNIKYPAALRQRFWHLAERAACGFFHWVLWCRSRDMTVTASQGPTLVLAPHADDETLGCGGLIALKRQAGTDVTVAIATDGSNSHLTEPTAVTSRADLIALREKETRLACSTLGVEQDHVLFLGFKDGEMEQHLPALSDTLRKLIEDVKPKDVFVCALTDGHPDHVALAEATRHAVHRACDPSLRLFEYPIWSFDFRSWRDPAGTNTTGFLRGVQNMLCAAFSWNMRALRLRGLRSLKAKALREHRSQLGIYPPEPDWSGLPDHFLRHLLWRTELFHEVDINPARLR